jgi:hypothetical protein
MNDPLLMALEQNEVRSGATYYSPAHLVNYQKPYHGVPYWMTPGGIEPYQMYIATFFAPLSTYGAATPATGVQQTAIYGSGQAPTSGIYTGVEDHCNG